MKQPSDQGALAVVDTATGKQSKQFLAFMLGQVGVDIGANEF